jgi:hypothetical protein
MGVFLDVLRSTGWQAQGVEFSPSAAQMAIKKGFQVFQGDWQNASFSENTFDLISLWDVIEHIPEPVKALQRIVLIPYRSHISSGDTLYVVAQRL